MNQEHGRQSYLNTPTVNIIMLILFSIYYEIPKFEMRYKAECTIRMMIRMYTGKIDQIVLNEKTIQLGYYENNYIMLRDQKNGLD